MNSRVHSCRQARITSVVLSVCLIYQLGACPCGCLEHNHWLRVLGLADHDGDLAVDVDRATLVVQQEHDCSHDPRVQFVSTSRSWEGSSCWLCDEAVVLQQPLVAVALTPSRRSLDRGPPGPLGTNALLSSLQVFLL